MLKEYEKDFTFFTILIPILYSACKDIPEKVNCWIFTNHIDRAEMILFYVLRGENFWALTGYDKNLLVAEDSFVAVSDQLWSALPDKPGAESH